MTGTTAAPRRHPHAVLDLPSRRLKALKIERLLELTPQSGPLKVLEIGCGTGGISHYFGTHPDLECEVDAVDVADQRKIDSGYRFTLVSDCSLPFPDASFDVVITNHVIEHVGDRSVQAEHLSEVRRVMRPGGKGYLAVPNRWQVVEPHYRLAFLSWLPHAFRTPYLKVMGKGQFYDCEPLTVAELESLLSQAGFEFNNVCVFAVRLMLELEHRDSPLDSLVRNTPTSVLNLLKGVIPTLTYVLR